MFEKKQDIVDGKVSEANIVTTRYRLEEIIAESMTRRTDWARQYACGTGISTETVEGHPLFLTIDEEQERLWVYVYNGTDDNGGYVEYDEADEVLEQLIAERSASPHELKLAYAYLKGTLPSAVTLYDRTGNPDPTVTVTDHGEIVVHIRVQGDKLTVTGIDVRGEEIEPEEYADPERVAERVLEIVSLPSQRGVGDLP